MLTPDVAASGDMAPKPVRIRPQIRTATQQPRLCYTLRRLKNDRCRLSCL